MRNLAVLTEQHLNEQLSALAAHYQAMIDAATGDVVDAIAAVMVQDQRSRDLLASGPNLAPHDGWVAHWQIRRRVATTLSQLQFAIRQYDRAVARLQDVAMTVIAAADTAVAVERSFAVAYDPSYVLTVVEPHALRMLRALAGGVLPSELRLCAYEAPGVRSPVAG